VDEQPEIVEIEIKARRDEALEERLLEAVIADRNNQPRNKQAQVGPSAIGFCRELLRAGLFETDLPELVADETEWATAAHVGTVMGDELERIFGERLDAVTQQRITTLLDEWGVSISGASDVIFVNDNQITDLKSMTDAGGILYDMDKNAVAIARMVALRREGLLFNHMIPTSGGEYEETLGLLSRFAKLHYFCQVATYVKGAIQAEILSEGAEGRLVFYDRSGNYQGFIAIEISAEEIDLFYEIAQVRIQQVVAAQEFLDKGADLGQMHKVFGLRDQAPSFCFSPKVMCPLRMRCWAGYEPTEDQMISAADLISAKERYAEGRRLANLADGMKKSARDDLKGITGVFPDGDMLSWDRRGAISLVTPAPRKIKAPSEGASPQQESLEAAPAAAESAPQPQTVPSEGPFFDDGGQQDIAYEWTGNAQASDSHGVNQEPPPDPEEFPPPPEDVGPATYYGDYGQAPAFEYDAAPTPTWTEAPVEVVEPEPVEEPAPEPVVVAPPTPAQPTPEQLEYRRKDAERAERLRKLQQSAEASRAEGLAKAADAVAERLARGERP
jgi:hypothetical protein